MAKDPAFLFYSSDYLTGTKMFTYEQKGKYIELLCLQHQQGHISEEDMMNICGRYDERIFKKFIKTDAGMYYNQRLEDECNKRKKYSESRRNNRKGKKDMSMICETYVGAMSPHMENENENTISNTELSNNTSKAKRDFSKLPGEAEMLTLAECATYYFTVTMFSVAIEANCMRAGIKPVDLAAWAKDFNGVQAAKGVIGKTLKEWAEHFSNWLKYQNTANLPAGNSNGKKPMVF